MQRKIIFDTGIIAAGNTGTATYTSEPGGIIQSIRLAADNADFAIRADLIVNGQKVIENLPGLAMYLDTKYDSGKIETNIKPGATIIIQATNGSATQATVAAMLLIESE